LIAGWRREPDCDNSHRLSNARSISDPDGNRVQKDVDGTVTTYLIDPYNHTGYSQVLKETTDSGPQTTVYMMGDDVLAQVTDTADPEYLLYDGHGSTRQLMYYNTTPGEWLKLPSKSVTRQ